MSVFEYECDVCGMRFDVHRHYGDPHPTTCPDGHQGVHRVFAPPTIIFKGSGFYVTDNGRRGRRGSKHKESAKTEKQEPKTETKAGDQT